MDYLEVVEILRQRARARPPAWIEAFAEQFSVTPDFVEDMLEGKKPVFPHMIGELAKVMGLKLTLVELNAPEMDFSVTAKPKSEAA